MRFARKQEDARLSPLSSQAALYRTGDADYMTSLARGLHVIRAFDAANSRLTIADVSRSTGLTRAVVRRCLYTLCELGYAAMDGRLFYLQPRVLALGYAWLASAPLHSKLQALAEELNGSLGYNVAAGVLDGGDVLCIAHAPNKREPASSILGRRFPAYCTAIGRVLLASLGHETLAAELSRVELVAYTRHTVTSRKRLEEILASTRSDGFALSDQELEAGLRGLAIPVRDANGHFLAAVGVSSEAGRLSRRDWMERCLPALRASAQKLAES